MTTIRITATYPATDGTAPESIEIEIEHDGPVGGMTGAFVANTVCALADVAIGRRSVDRDDHYRPIPTHLEQSTVDRYRDAMKPSGNAKQPTADPNDQRRNSGHPDDDIEETQILDPKYDPDKTEVLEPYPGSMIGRSPHPTKGYEA
jgi:hypothetical protein